MKEANRCAFIGCHAAPVVGQPLCGEHRLKPLTTREAIAEGPRFEPVVGRCIACGEALAQTEPGNEVDRVSGLGPNCWRAWRWSPIRERGRD